MPDKEEWHFPWIQSTCGMYINSYGQQESENYVFDMQLIANKSTKLKDDVK